MNIKMKWVYRLGFLLLFLIVLFILLKLKPFWGPLLDIVGHVSLPFLTGAFIAYLLHPLVVSLYENGLPKWLSLFIIYLLFFGGLGFLVYKGTPLFIMQLRDLSDNIPLFLQEWNRFSERIKKHTAHWPIPVEEYLNQFIVRIDSSVSGFVKRLPDQMFHLFDWLIFIVLIPIIAFYMIKDGDYLREVFWELVPVRWRRQLRIFLQNIDEQLGGYIRGQLLLCLIVGFFSTLLFRLIDIKYPLLLGIIIGVTNVIPYFGPIIGAIPACLVALTVSVNKTLLVVLIILALQFLDGNILSPFILGKSLRMHPLLIILAILIGGELFGVVGLIVAVPIVAISKTAFQQAILQFHSRENRE